MPKLTGHVEHVGALRLWVGRITIGRREIFRWTWAL